MISGVGWSRAVLTLKGFTPKPCVWSFLCVFFCRSLVSAPRRAGSFFQCSVVLVVRWFMCQLGLVSRWWCEWFCQVACCFYALADVLSGNHVG